MAKGRKQELPALTGDMDEKIRQAIAQANKQFGVGTCTILGEQKPIPLERVDSGSFSINEIMGGGCPRGRIIEIYGPESSGKTTVALHAIAEIQKEAKRKGTGKKTLYVDAEHALDLNYAEALGVNTSELIFCQPDTGEQALQIVGFWVKSGLIDGFVVDSVAALVTQNELDGEIGDSHVGQLARLMSQSMRMLAGAINRANVIGIFINQLREKVGVMFGNPETTPGGRALKFYSAIRLDVRTAEIVKDRSGYPVLKKTKITAVKNKTASPLRVAFVDIEFGSGISRAGEVIDYGVDYGIIDKNGNWFVINGESFNGREAAKQFLNNHPDLMNDFVDKINLLMSPQFEAEEPLVAGEEAESEILTTFPERELLGLMPSDDVE